MFEFAHVAPEGSSSIHKLVSAAKKCGYSSLVIRNHNTAFTNPKISTENLKLFSGIEIKTQNVEKMKEAIKNNKQLDFICVHGGNPNINKATVNSKNVDILCHPWRGKKRSYNHALIKEASQNEVAIEFNLSNILRSSGGKRVSAIRDIKTVLKLVKKYKAPFIISVDAFCHLDLRGFREIKSTCKILGFKKEDVYKGMKSTPLKILTEDKPIDIIEE